MASLYGPPSPLPVMPQSVIRYGEQPIWSTYRLARGTALSHTQHRLFTVPRGQTGQGFTRAISIAETNLWEGGRLPGGMAYDVNTVKIAIYASEGVARSLSRSMSWAWDFTQVLVDGGLMDDLKRDDAGVLTSTTVYLKQPVCLPSNTNFAMLLRFGEATFGMDEDGLVNKLPEDVDVRITLFGAFKTVVEIG